MISGNGKQAFGSQLWHFMPEMLLFALLYLLLWIEYPKVNNIQVFKKCISIREF